MSKKNSFKKNIIALTISLISSFVLMFFSQQSLITQVNAANLNSKSTEVSNSTFTLGSGYISWIDYTQGIVQLKYDNSSYPVYNADGVVTRYLPANSRWKFDEVLVMTDGSVWYRVSTNEFLSLNDVFVIS